MSNHEAHSAYVALQDDLDAATTELAAVQAELAEANAVIGGVKAARQTIAARERAHYNRWNEEDHDSDAAACSAYADAGALLDKVEGL